MANKLLQPLSQIGNIKSSLIDLFINNSKISTLSRNKITDIMNEYYLFTENKKLLQVNKPEFPFSSEQAKIVIEKLENIIRELKQIKGKELLKELNWVSYNKQIADYELTNIEEYKCFFDSDSIEFKQQHKHTLSYNFNMGMFNFDIDNLTYMPIHDHPGMFVFSKCLFGELKVVSFTEKSKNNIFGIDEERLFREGKSKESKDSNDSINSNTAGVDKNLLDVEMTADGLLKEDDWMLTFPNKHNYHLVYANTPSVLLDFFIPHYDLNNEVSYYESEHSLSNKNSLKIRKF